jgi:hypothetical protein
LITSAGTRCALKENVRRHAAQSAKQVMYTGLLPVDVFTVKGGSSATRPAFLAGHGIPRAALERAAARAAQAPDRRRGRHAIRAAVRVRQAIPAPRKQATAARAHDAHDRARHGCGASTPNAAIWTWATLAN